MPEPSLTDLAAWAVIAAGVTYAALARRGVGPAIAGAVLAGAVTKIALLQAT